MSSLAADAYLTGKMILRHFGFTVHSLWSSSFSTKTTHKCTEFIFYYYCCCNCFYHCYCCCYCLGEDWLGFSFQVILLWLKVQKRSYGPQSEFLPHSYDFSKHSKGVWQECCRQSRARSYHKILISNKYSTVIRLCWTGIFILSFFTPVRSTALYFKFSILENTTPATKLIAVKILAFQYLSRIQK